MSLEKRIKELRKVASEFNETSQEDIEIYLVEENGQFGVAVLGEYFMANSYEQAAMKATNYFEEALYEQRLEEQAEIEKERYIEEYFLKRA